MSKLTIKLTVTPSLNKLHSNRWQMWNYKKKYLRELRGYELLALKGKNKMAVDVTRYGSRLLDQDNFTGGLKPLVDSLKEKGLLVDDSPDWCELFIEQKKCKRGEEKTVVVIEDYGQYLLGR